MFLNERIIVNISKNWYTTVIYVEDSGRKKWKGMFQALFHLPSLVAGKTYITLGGSSKCFALYCTTDCSKAQHFEV